MPDKLPGKSIEDIDRMLSAVSKKQGWMVNTNPEFLFHIKKGLIKNHQKHGYYACPCRDADGDLQSDRDIVCPCIYAREDIKDFGQCFCGLYLKQDHETPDQISQIPERRLEGD